MSDRVLFAFDGTWNEPSALELSGRKARPEFGDPLDHLRDTTETNVLRFQRMYGDDRSLYISGVGTRYGTPGRILGGATGAGAQARIRQAYVTLCQQWEKGDHEVDVVGFSRGAALAIHFCNVARFSHSRISPSCRRTFQVGCVSGVLLARNSPWSVSRWLRFTVNT